MNSGRGPHGFQAGHCGVTEFFDCMDELFDRAASDKNAKPGFHPPVPILSALLIGSVKIERAPIVCYDRDAKTVTLKIGGLVAICADQIERYLPTLFHVQTSCAPPKSSTEPVRYVKL